MFKDYNPIKCQQLRVFGIPEDVEKVQARTRSFIQWVRFNKSDPKQMAKAVKDNPKMHFLINCKMLIDDTVKCKGITFQPYCYIWKDEYFNLINEARKIYWAEIEKEDN